MVAVFDAQACQGHKLADSNVQHPRFAKKFLTTNQSQTTQTSLVSLSNTCHFCRRHQILIPFLSQTLKMSNAELATSYAALILADDGVDITVRFTFLRYL